MTKTLLNDERYYFEAFMKTVQYLATLTTQKGIMKNLEKLIKKFYNSDFFAFHESGADGTIIEHLNKFSNALFSKNGLEKIEETIVQVRESGFFASELINTPDPYAMVFLPISKANQIISVIVIGHKYSERLPKYLLNIYLALEGLIGTTIEKLTSIQELRKQHRKLKENDRFLTNVFTSITDGICVIDTDYNIIRVNPTMKKWYSFKEPLLRKKCYQIFLNKTERCKECSLDELFKTNKPFKTNQFFKKIIPRKGNRGKILGILEIYTFPLHDQETGKRTGAIEYIRDITKRRKAELKLQNLNVKLEKMVEERTKKLRMSKEELKKSESRFRRLYDSNMIGVAYWDVTGGIKDANDAYLNLIGYTREDLLSGKIDWIKMTPPELFYLDEKGMNEIKEKGVCTPFEKEYIRKDGSRVPIISGGASLEGEDEVGVNYLIDITERKKAENQLKESEAKYREAYNLVNFYKDLFAHDMNNILQSILSTAEFHSIFRDDPEKLKNFGDISELVKMHVGRGTSLISKVRALSKIKETEITLIPIVINNVLSKSVENARNSFYNKEIKIQIEGLLKDLKIMGDDLLIEVFDNILNNAIKFSDNNNEVKVDIIVSKIQVDDINYIRFEFKDYGPGIHDNRKETLFQEIFERDKSKQGMGIGLSLVMKIVNKYEGRIWVEDRIKGNYKEGSNFIVLLKEAP